MSFVRKKIFSPMKGGKAKPGTNSLCSSAIKMTFKFLFTSKVSDRSLRKCIFLHFGDWEIVISSSQMEEFL